MAKKDVHSYSETYREVPPEGDEGLESDDDSRSYIRVRPTDTALDPRTVEKHFHRLAQLRAHREFDGLLERLRSREAVPTIEFLLVSKSDSELSYYIGLDEPDLLNSLERLLRGLFPDSYEFTHVESVTDDFEILTATEVDEEIAAVEFLGRAERRNDWQTQLTPFKEFESNEQARIPLAAVVETMAESEIPIIYQALVRPKADWSHEAADRQVTIKMNLDTLGGQLADLVSDPPEEGYSLSEADEKRLKELEAKDARRSFDVNARALTFAADETEAIPVLQELATAFSDASRTSYEIRGAVSTGEKGQKIFEAVRNRTFQPPNYDRLSTRLPWTTNTSPGIVADATEPPNFCLLDGSALTTAGRRALAPALGEQTALSRPPKTELARYQRPGLTLGQPLSQDDTPTEPIALPPKLQPLHVAWFGKTGSGKSTGLTTAILDNHGATTGASILIDPKGDGMPLEYLRAHYATYGTLDNLYYFDCAEILPALSFFDIRPQLEAGIDRATAVQNTVDHYIELLIGIMGRDRFERAVRSPDIIRYLVKALFDPIHGSNAFTHRDLQKAATQMAETRDAPPVTDDDLAVMLGGVVTNSKRSFDELMQGVMNRIEKVPLDDRLAQLFNHVPQDTTYTTNREEDSASPTTNPKFDFFDVLDEDAVVIFDTGGLRTESRRALTLVLLSNLWTALRRRQRLHTNRRGRSEESPQDTSEGEPSLVNLYVEEAAEVAASGLMTDLLAKSRGFNLSVTLAMQFPAQVRNTDTEAYAEILNNISTIVTGNVAVDADLEKRLATEEIPPIEVGNRLRALRRGQWFASLPAGFQDREPRPFLLSSAPLPAGHPEGEQPLTETQTLAFEALLDSTKDRTRLDYGLDFLAQSHAQSSPSSRQQSTQMGSDSIATETTNTRVDSALPYTKRMPVCIRYNPEIHALVCTGCESRHDSSPTGIKRAINCCSSLDRVDREDVPICDVNLTLSPREREASAYSDRQLAFLQAVYAAHQNEYDSEWEYDICWDSMLRLQEYVGIESEEVDELVEDNLLNIDCNHPHRLYTVTADGRNEIQVAHREGIAYGHGVGDLGESSLHRVMVEFGRRYVETVCANQSDSDVVEVIPCYELDDGHRLDVAGLDADGEVKVVVEAERTNHDILRAVPDDYDKMAAFDPEDAIWIVKNRDAAHDILEALNEPPTGERRVEKVYSRTSPPQAFRLDSPGCSEIHTLQYVRNSLLDLEPP